jgi:hypothetical protein
MSRVEVLSARSGGDGGARRKSGRSLRRLLRLALRFARSPGSEMSFPDRFIAGEMSFGVLPQDLPRWWSTLVGPEQGAFVKEVPELQ